MYTLNFTFVWANSQLLRDGLLVTLELSSVALFFSVLVGLIGAYARISPFRPISSTAGAYVEFVRNVPLLLLLYFVYFALPSFHLTLSERVSAISALSLYSGAYMIEIFRAGILAVGRGQVEAGKALGNTGFQIARAVVVPQALRIVLPSMGNQFISLIKDSSLA